jgi:hypothetical protein
MRFTRFLFQLLGAQSKREFLLLAPLFVIVVTLIIILAALVLF